MRMTIGDGGLDGRVGFGMLGAVPDAAEPIALDLSDFDAVGVVSSVVVALRSHAILAEVAAALERRGWQPDEDREGATRTFPPGSEPTDAAFEVLAALTAAGAPAGVRAVTAVDAKGDPVSIG
jgi:hypothetical protein